MMGLKIEWIMEEVKAPRAIYIAFFITGFILKGILDFSPLAVQIFKYVLYVIGIFVLFIVVILAMAKRSTKKREKERRMGKW